MPVETPARVATLLSITPQIPNVQTLRLEPFLPFRPGQAIQIIFPGENKKRFYSISSSPTEGPFFEITVKGEPGSALSKALAALKRGDALEIEGPLGGSLGLPDPVEEPLVFIAAGTGVAPFRSMIKSLIDGSSPVHLWLLHSVRAQNELLFHDDFLSWSGALPRFHYVPTITKDFDADWKNETGRINETLIRKHVTSGSCTYFLCGPSAFAQDMENALQKTLGIAADKIRREKW